MLNPDMLSVLLVVPEQMSVWNLYFYMQHLRDNKQKTSRFEIALWTVTWQSRFACTPARRN